MKTWNRFANKHALRWVGLAVLFLGLTGETCTEDREIEVVVGASVFATFEARGIVNTFHGEKVVDIATDADVRQILEDNGFEGHVIVRIESAFYRVVKKDQNATDRTVTGTVTVRREGGADMPLLSGSAPVNDDALAAWTPAPLDAAGVTLINATLQDWVNQIVAGNPNPPSPVVIFTTDGTSSPQNISTDFDWEIQVKMTLAGKKTVKVIEPI